MTNLNKDIKVFFIDLDGTLLDSQDNNGNLTISRENIKEIKKIQEAKKHVVISTGRYGDQVQKFMKLTNVKYSVTANGAYVIDNNRKLYKDDKLSIRQIILLVDFARKHELSFKVNESWIAYGVRKPLQKFIVNKWGFTAIGHYNCDLQREYPKIIFFGKTKWKIQKLVALLTSEIDGLSVVTSAKGYTIEVTNEKSTKGIGNIYVAKMLGITKKNNMMHIGDTMNDSTVARHMRLVAMKNSEKKLKKITKFIGPSYKNGGVAKVLRGEYKKIT
ncbi:Cof-type HAD-IIB family hydrolase [Candidatus Mycoplasma mahonii]|uniref:Cof-type HAD-IIB family hydrolase n=1 Tax=Candidatus Mycoplasma mahonii TaxID=3004105 RepID=UPI0026ED931E|nr:Cof-type HAD-IIB family hydrolase [Candidatus Mycoplasma mahonii]WKX02413.1 Cof-type HAD-IIB family hydrolase [Candidatus Mycoplasma mahonii]